MTDDLFFPFDDDPLTENSFIEEHDELSEEVSSEKTGIGQEIPQHNQFNCNGTFFAKPSIGAKSMIEYLKQKDQNSSDDLPPNTVPGRSKKRSISFKSK